jgi:hypothetical protein
MKREGESELAPFDQNLLIPVDLSRLRQIVIKLVSRRNTNGGEWRAKCERKVNKDGEVIRPVSSQLADFLRLAPIRANAD